LRLPPFLRQDPSGEDPSSQDDGSQDDGSQDRQNRWSDQDLQDGFRLTGLFLLRHVLEPRGQGHSDAREGFIHAVTRHRARLAAR
jgi:DNA repair protein RecO (recombination protein O)